MEPRNFGAFVGQMHESFHDEDHPALLKPIEEARVRSVQRMMAALERGDLDGFLDEMHPDVELEIHAPAEFPWRLHARGRDELRALVEHNFATVTGQQPEVLDVVAQGNLLVVVGRERGRLRDERGEYDVHFVYRFTFREDKVSRVLELVTHSRDV